MLPKHFIPKRFHSTSDWLIIRSLRAQRKHDPVSEKKYSTAELHWSDFANHIGNKRLC